jgi:hypothetical protein
MNPAIEAKPSGSTTTFFASNFANKLDWVEKLSKLIETLSFVPHR